MVTYIALMSCHHVKEDRRNALNLHAGDETFCAHCNKWVIMVDKLYEIKVLCDSCTFARKTLTSLEIANVIGRRHSDKTGHRYSVSVSGYVIDGGGRTELHLPWDVT